MTNLATPPATELLDLPLVRIHPALDNVRRTIDEDALEELAESMRQLGVLEPILVSADRELDGDYEIVAGERRWRAAKLAGLATIPAVVRRFNDEVERLLAMLAENLQRADLDPIDEAEAFVRLTKELKVSQRTLAERVGRSQSHIAKRSSLTKLPDEAKAALRDDRLTITQATALAGLKDRAEVKRIVAKAGADGRVNGFDIEQAVKKQERVEQQAKAEKEFADSGLAQAPADTWNGNWVKLDSADGATHATIVGGRVIYYRQKTKAEKEPKPAKDPATPASPSKPSPTVERSAEDLERARREAVWETATRQRRTFLAGILDGIVEDNPTVVDKFLAATILTTLAGVELGDGDHDGYWSFDSNEEIACELLGLDVQGNDYTASRNTLALHFTKAHLSDRIAAAVAVCLSGFIGIEGEYGEITDGAGMPGLPAIYEQFLLHAGYQYGADEKAELIRIGYLVDDSDEIETAQAEAETTGEDPALSPVVDAPDTSTPAAPDSALVQADEAGDEEPTPSSSPADPDDDLPKASDDRMERLKLAKTEGKALKAWTAAGETGPRPHTPNLDFINGTRV